MKNIELMDPFLYILAAELRRYEGLKSVLDYSTNRRAKHINITRNRYRPIKLFYTEYRDGSLTVEKTKNVCYTSAALSGTVKSTSSTTTQYLYL